jgi:hypothetical protein
MSTAALAVSGPLESRGIQLAIAFRHYRVLTVTDWNS